MSIERTPEDVAQFNSDMKRIHDKLLFIQALLETVAESGDGGAPSGICFVAMQQHGVDIEAYQGMVDGLVAAGLITCKSHLLRATPKAKALMGGVK